ncbi:hypothetical protein AAHZ94_23550 [Streptomyces sp. HSW2009]|uniref:hypothetical protein n=1 Tax=Streptomyces sp. HSW2009 TaxID=3142890 RepID=UPI0032EB77CF
MAMRRRITTAITAVAAVSLAVPLMVGCNKDDVEKAVDCAELAVDISDNIDDLQQALLKRAVMEGTGNEKKSDEALDEINKNIDELDRKTDNPDIDKALDHLDQAVDNAAKAAKNGEKPDFSPVADAGRELAGACKPG